ncbi:MAG: hypothetical protein U1E56_03175 [Bauldia sp.]
MRRPLTTLVIGFWLAGGAAAVGQSTAFAPDFRDLGLGLNAATLSTDGYDTFACGADGGQSLKPLKGWRDFAECARDASGLHEVAVEFGLEDKLLADQYREQYHEEAWFASRAGTQVAGFPVVMSLLFDDQGISRGFRTVTDPRAGGEARARAFLMRDRLKPRFDMATATDCTSRPPSPGQTGVGAVFVNERCEKVIGGKRIVVETHLFRRPGQTGFNANGIEVAGEYESLTRWEVWDEAYRRAAPGQRP